MTLLAILIGCLTGFVSAFFGIGGSSIDTPLLRTFLGLPPLEALGTPLPLTLITASIALFAFRKHDLVDWRLALLSLAAGLPGMIAGSLLTQYVSARFLMLLTAVVLFLVGVDFIVKDLTERSFGGRRTEPRPNRWLVLFVSGAIGILSGLLANGGGIFFVPAFVVIYGLPVKRAIATSLVVVAVMALPGSIIHFALGHVNVQVMLALAVGIVPMAYMGARLDIKSRSRTILLLYGAVMSVFAVYFFISQLMVT